VLIESGFDQGVLDLIKHFAVLAKQNIAINSVISNCLDLDYNKKSKLL